MPKTEPSLGASAVVALPEGDRPYSEAQFAEDTAAVARLVDPEPPVRQNGRSSDERVAASDEERVQRACDYFYATYDAEEAGRRYLRFGAVHAAIGRHGRRIEEAGLADTDAAGGVDRFLLLLLLTAPVMVNTQTRAAWLLQSDVEGAIRRAKAVRPA